jgi:hypothetical protein
MPYPKGRPQSPESNAKRSVTLTGRKMSAVTIERSVATRRSNGARRGQYFSEQALANFREGALRRARREEISGAKRGALNPAWKGDDASYGTLHMRLNAWRGQASHYTCVDCGDPAYSWAFRHDTPEEFVRVSAEGYPYSTRVEDYDPRCAPCHGIYDRKQVLV